MFNKNTLIEINNNLKILEKEKEELILKKEKLTFKLVEKIKSLIQILQSDM